MSWAAAVLNSVMSGCRDGAGFVGGLIILFAVLFALMLGGLNPLGPMGAGWNPQQNRPPVQNKPGGNPAGGGPGGGTLTVAPVPPISDRFFDTGTSHAEVSGALTLAGDLAIDTIASYVSNHGRANIVFGPPDPNALLVQVTFNEPEDTVTVIQGDKRATGMDTDCVFNVQVTEALVAGHISCPSVDAFDGEQNLGKATIELDFSAGSIPGDDGNPDGGDGTTDPGAKATDPG